MNSSVGQQWQGKKWYCYGTSMTDSSEREIGDVGPKSDNHPNMTTKTGLYPGFLAAFAGLEEHNFGKGGSGVIPALHGEDSIKSRVMTLEDGKAEADLITIELIPNDDLRGELGEVTDWSDDTFCGNVNQMLAWLLGNTDAVVAILIATRCRYSPYDAAIPYLPTGEEALKRLQWEETLEKLCRIHGIPCWNGAAEANLGYYRMGMHQKYVKDQIHLTEKGGEILAKYFWGKLQGVYPVK